METSAYSRAAEYIAEADGLLITAGAGMGVDSGLPDFRGTEGFWRTYPALKAAGISFEKIANPHFFRVDPGLAWGFYGHLLALYRRTVPHAGFQLLRAISNRMAHGAYVFTSNVDGQFQKAGFKEGQVLECHGSIHWLQCQMPGCNQDIWCADAFKPRIDASECRLINRPPACPICGGVARPNILMFDDWHWVDRLAEIRRGSLKNWLSRVERPVIVELGAGKEIATVRNFGIAQKVPLVRINPADDHFSSNREGVLIKFGALNALQRIYDELLNRDYFGH